MIVQRYQNRKGECVHIESEHEIELSDIEWLVKNPILDSILAYPSKDECKASQYLIYWGERINPDNSQIKQNQGRRWAIALDYDDGYRMETFNEKFNGRFQYYIYTSFSHAPAHHKFRVIIPTTESFEMTPHLKNVLKRCFPVSVKGDDGNAVVLGVDGCTFDPRGFYEPVKLNEHYTYFISNGPVFDVEKRLGKMIEAEKQNYENEQKRIADEREARIKAREARGEPPPDLEFQKKWTLNNSLAKYHGCGHRKTGSRYTDLKNYTTALLLAEYWTGEGYMFDVDEVEDIILSEHDDRNVRRLVRDMIKFHRDRCYNKIEEVSCTSVSFQSPCCSKGSIQ